LTSPDKDIAALRELGREAAPVSSSHLHATDAELARLRADDESPGLDAAYRHLATCAVCRARLLDPVRLVERVSVAVRLAPEHEARGREIAGALGLEAIAGGVGCFTVFAETAAAEALVSALEAVPHHHGSSSPLLTLESSGSVPALEAEAWRALEAAAARAPTPVVVLRPRRRVALGWAAAAAALALAIGAGALRHRDAGPMAISQRSYVGMMGGADGGTLDVAPEDRDVELSLTAPDPLAAALVAVDAEGRALAPVRWFRRGEGGRLVAVVARRTFAEHAGDAFGLVVVGDTESVQGAVRDVTVRPAGSLDAAEAAIRERRGVRVQRVVIGR
jgi:hypothetical protein